LITAGGQYALNAWQVWVSTETQCIGATVQAMMYGQGMLR